MKLETLTAQIHELTQPGYQFTIHENLFTAPNWKKEFNNRIRQNVQDEIGIYVWTNGDTSEILYIGMAGKLQKNGGFANHTVQKRLLASRGKDSTTGKYIQTNEYIKQTISNIKCSSIDIHVFHTKPNQLPGYVEAVLINAYFQATKTLPPLNTAF
jgi:hypothetical protein